MNDNWDVATGVRSDERRDDSAVVPLTQEQGERTDAVVQVGYDSKGRWGAYGFVQDTVSIDGDREENGRVGTGGSYRISERLKVNAEVSDGDLGVGGKVGTNYLHNDRTTLYLNYALENERTDNGLLATRGSEGNTVAGVKTRLSDSTSVYLEERYRNSDWSSGLTHATGISLAPTERLEPRREHRHRHAARRADGRRDRPPRGGLPRRLWGKRAAVVERRRVPPRRDRSARSFAEQPQDVAVAEQLQVPATRTRRACSASSTTPTA